MVVGDEPVEGGLRAGLELVDQFGFVTAPREGAGPIGHAVPFWRGGPLRACKYKPETRVSGAACRALSAHFVRHRKERRCFQSFAWPRDNLAPERTIVQWAAGGGTNR